MVMTRADESQFGQVLLVLQDVQGALFRCSSDNSNDRRLKKNLTFDPKSSL